MNKYKINYSIKNTKSNNTYIEISSRDEQIFLQTILSVNAYLQELCLSTDPDIKHINTWYRRPDTRFPYNKRLNRRNTPETMLAGLINNMIFGNQDNLSMEQLPYYEEIINTAVEIIEELQCVKNINLQKMPCMTGIQFGLGF